jgi:hypothetical protein
MSQTAIIDTAQYGSVESAKPAQSALFATRMGQQRAIGLILVGSACFLLSGQETALWQIEGHLGGETDARKVVVKRG